MFGLVTLLQGLAVNYTGILVTRFFLGVFETGMFPGALYVMGMWYRRNEAGKRFTFFLSSTTLAGAFGGLLASALGKMDGVGGKAGWRWIFIIEGAATILAGIVLYFCLPTFPEEAKWLSARDKAMVEARSRADHGVGQSHKISIRDIPKVLCDLKIIVAGFMYFGALVTVYSYAFFAPAIIYSLGFSRVQTQLRSVPPNVVAFVMAMALAALSDMLQHRYLFILFPMLLSMGGLAMLLAIHDNANAQYAALFLVVAGVFSALPIIICWFNMNLAGHLRRAVGSGWQVGFGNIGGIVAIFAFLAKDAPQFVSGYSICIGFLGFCLILCTLYGYLCARDNRRRERDALRGTVPVLTEAEKRELGDLSPEFRYLL